MTNEFAIKVLTELRGYGDNFANIGFDRKEALDLAIKALEIELLTDKEQRIFLKAMSREREVCRKVDDEYADDDSKISLVMVCNSIERKVKKIWK